MKRSAVLQEIRKMRFEEVYDEWVKKRFTQEEAARCLGICDRTFRRYVTSYEEKGLEGLIDKRLNQISHRCAPVDEVMRLTTLYRSRYIGWNAKHFFGFYQRMHEGSRSYTWVKKTLQAAGLIQKKREPGVHRQRRERAPMTGMLIHQDGSTHEWVPNQKWDLIITFDDANSEYYSMFFVEEEGTQSSFLGVKETIAKKGLFCSLYTDRGSHYWHTPLANGKVDKQHYTQFRRALHQLGIEMIPAYSPEARGRCERQFRTHQGRLPQELAAAGIQDIPTANRYLKEVYLPAFNTEFGIPFVGGSAFVAYNQVGLEDILCEQFERGVGKDNCVSFENLILQIPKDDYRCHYVKATVRVHRYFHGELAIFHGPRKLATYDNTGKLIDLNKGKKAA